MPIRRIECSVKIECMAHANGLILVWSLRMLFHVHMILLSLQYSYIISITISTTIHLLGLNFFLSISIFTFLSFFFVCLLNFLVVVDKANKFSYECYPIHFIIISIHLRTHDKMYAWTRTGGHTYTETVFRFRQYSCH